MGLVRHVWRFMWIGWAAALGACGVSPSGPAPDASAAVPVPQGLQALSAADGPTIYANICAQCHGPEGKGNLAVKAPSVAAMPAWYTREQLEKFRTGQRGADPKDPSGFLMRAVAVQMTPAMVQRVTAHMESLPRSATKNTLAGNAAEGKWKYARYCMECHRYNASGELVFGSPPLTKLPDWYMAEQLRKFQAGLRGSHPRDERGAKMVRVVRLIEKPQDIRDILAYIAELAKQPPRQRRPRRHGP